MLRRLLLVAITAVFLGACATYHGAGIQRPEDMPYRYSQFDLLLGWDVQVVGGDILVSGVAKNVRYFYMNQLEIWVAVLDPAGKVAARSVSFVIPSQLPMDETAQFSLKLPVAVTPGTKLRFTYKYRGSDGGGGSDFGGSGAGEVKWWQSFDFVAPEMSTN